jgi:hypothetical protein
MADLKPAWDQDQVIRWYQVDVQVPGPCSQKKGVQVGFSHLPVDPNYHL